MNRVLFSVGVAAAACLLSWILFGRCFAGPVLSGLQGVWGVMNIIPMFVALLLSGNPHSALPGFYEACVFAQWFGVSFLLFPLMRRMLR
jgi:hypothetical protein